MSSSSLPSSWPSVWDGAQTRFASIREFINTISPPQARILRVGKLDAEQLDEQLVYLLQEPLAHAFELVNTSLKARFDPELTLFIQIVLYKLSIWNSGASYGAKLQDLRYISSRFSSGRQSPSGLPRRILILHGALTVIIPYLHTRLRTYALSHAWPDAPSEDQRHKAWSFLIKIESTYALLGLSNFVLFLWDGRYRTIADRLLGLMLVPARRLMRRDVSYEFMNRQMVWHAFTEFLLFLLPFISGRSIRRRLTSLMSILMTFFSSPKRVTGTYGRPIKKRGKYYFLSPDQCAICAENASYTLNLSKPDNIFTSYRAISDAHLTDSDSSELADEDDHDEPVAFQITTPYITSCGHTYCYHCTVDRMLRAADDDADEGRWECLRCGARVERADRVIEKLEQLNVRSECEDEDNFGSNGTSDQDITGSIGSLTSKDTQSSR